MRDDPVKKAAAVADCPAVVRRPTPERVRSETLLGSARELIIDHHGREYRLRLTQQGKLILTA